MIWEKGIIHQGLDVDCEWASAKYAVERRHKNPSAGENIVGLIIETW